MKSWKQPATAALVSGSLAAVTSTAALAACGATEISRPLAPTNAVSHWFFGERATRQDHFSWRHTVVGYATHHVASLFWAFLYERFFAARRARATPGRIVGDAIAVAGVACFVDYQLTPRRFVPGYERRLSRTSLALVYLAFAAGLAAGGALLNRRLNRHDGQLTD
jgi:hypothetical protein